MIKLYTRLWEFLLTFIKQIKHLCYSSTKNAFKLEFSDNLWLPFIDQPQSDIVVFEIITFQIYIVLVTKSKHRIGPNDIITFNEELEFLSK